MAVVEILVTTGTKGNQIGCVTKPLIPGRYSKKGARSRPLNVPMSAHRKRSFEIITERAHSASPEKILHSRILHLSAIVLHHFKNILAKLVISFLRDYQVFTVCNGVSESQKSFVNEMRS